MFGIGLAELIVIFVVLLIVMGPDRLPEVARKIGKVMRDFKDMGKELRDDSYEE